MKRVLPALVLVTACSRPPNPNAGVLYHLEDGELIRGEPAGDWQSALLDATREANRWCAADAMLVCRGGACLSTGTFPFEHHFDDLAPDRGPWIEHINALLHAPTTVPECHTAGQALAAIGTFWEQPSTPGEIWCRGYLDPSAPDEPAAATLCTHLVRLADTEAAEATTSEG